jgi:chaperone BCS1
MPAAVTLGMTLTLLTSLLSFFTYSFSSLTAFGRFISDNLVSSATIHSSDVTYLYIMRWLAEHKHSTDCRLFCVTSRKNMQSLTVRRYHYHYGERTASSDDEDDDMGLDDDPSDEDKLGPKLKYTPAPGMFPQFLFSS